MKEAENDLLNKWDLHHLFHFDSLNIKKKYHLPLMRKTNWCHAQNCLFKVHHDLLRMIAGKVLREELLTQHNSTCALFCSPPISNWATLCVAFNNTVPYGWYRAVLYSSLHPHLAEGDPWQNYFNNANKFGAWLFLSPLYLVMNPWIIWRQNSYKDFFKTLGNQYAILLK